MKTFLLLFTDPNRLGGCVLLSALFAIVSPATFIFDARAEDAREQFHKVDGVKSAVRHIIFTGVRSYGIKPYYHHHLALDDEGMEKLAEAIVNSSERHGTPEMLLVAMAFRENSFRDEKEGDLGERSTFQIMPKTAKAIREGLFSWSDVSEPECDLDTVRGAALCAAALLRINKERCKSWQGAVVLYATGHTCKRDTMKLRWIAQDRTGIQKYFENLFMRGNDE